MPNKFLERNSSLTWLLIFIYASFIFYLSSIPYPAQPIKGYEKEAPLIEHILEFSILGFLLIPGFKSLGYRKFLPLALIFGIFYGISDELHQFFVPGRYASLLDILADSVGIFLGSLIAFLRS